MIYDVFISYSRKDTAVADKIVNALEAAGITCFIDRRGIGGGMEYPMALAKAIKESKVFLFLASENSYRSKFTINEITYAFNKKERNKIYPYIIDDSNLPEDLEFVFAGINLRTRKEHPIEIVVEDVLHLLGTSDLRMANLKAQGWVDLGLPSGTLWKDENEEGYYTFDEAISKFGDDVPTKEQLVELEDLCQWEWTGRGYKIVGPNGESIVLPAAGYQSRDGKCYNVGFSGEYLSSARIGSDFAQSLLLLSSSVHWGKLSICCSYLVSVRLVKNNLEEVLDKYMCDEAKIKNMEQLNRNEKENSESRELTFFVDDISFIMVCVGGGKFQMGSPDNTPGVCDNEKPQHWVMLRDFYIGETVVTQAMWKAVMGSNPSYFKGEEDVFPVEKVSWDDCQNFIMKLNLKTGRNFRLPTEAEWEYAARGGGKSKHYKYSGGNNIDNVAWYYHNSANPDIIRKLHPVKQKMPNELGLYDMSGNVWEWCQDWYSNYDKSLINNPQGPKTGVDRILRGGSWNDYASYNRVSFRKFDKPNHRNRYFGFRLALDQ